MLLDIVIILIICIVRVNPSQSYEGINAWTTEVCLPITQDIASMYCLWDTKAQSGTHSWNTEIDEYYFEFLFYNLNW